MIREIVVPKDLWPRRGDWRGKIINIYVSEGDKVSSGDQLFEIEIEKAVLVIESEHNGVIKKILVEPGDDVRPGDPVMIIETSDD
jgi:pyruvate/2-oxoglutarate dehydrogenase complex dihydrolipoamide acyltransferase (E2) component